MRGPPLNTVKWFSATLDVAPAILAAPYGERRAALNKAACSVGVSTQTLRRYLAAAAWVDSLDEADEWLAEGLKTAPMAAIEHLARLHRRDPGKAIETAKSLLRGDETVRSIALIATSRPPPSHALIARSGRKLEIDYRDYLIAAITNGLRAIRVDVFGPSEMPSLLPVDLEFQLDGRNYGLLIVGPYRDASIYRSRAADWCLKALGIVLASNSKMRVLICVPSAHEGDRYRTLLEKWEMQKKGVDLALLNRDEPQAEIWGKIRCSLRL